MISLIPPRSAAAQGAANRFERVLDDFVGVLGNLAAIAAIDVHGIGRFYWSSGHADSEKNAPASKDDAYQIGSQTKTLLAIALLRLHRLGVVSLDATVVSFIDLPIDTRITLRHCLMNTCGLGDKYLAIPWKRIDPRIAMTPRDTIALTLPQGQLFEPGARFDYCNIGWTIAAMVLEQVTGKSHSDGLHELVFAPLGLSKTQAGGEAPLEAMLRGYVESCATDGLIDTAPLLSWLYGSGDGISTLDDMLDLFAALRNSENALGLGLSDLTAATAKPNEDPYFALSFGTEYGLGLERRAWAGSEVWGHPGSTLAYLTGSWIDPAHGVSITTCVTRVVSTVNGLPSDASYPRAQLFALALATAYALADDLRAS